MAAYDHTYNPPAPVAEITISHPVAAVTSAPLRGKLDTGADLTARSKTVAALYERRRRTKFLEVSRRSQTAATEQPRF